MYQNNWKITEPHRWVNKKDYRSLTVEARREDRGREAMEYAKSVCINNVYTGAGCDVIGKFCDTPGLHQQGAMIRVAIILKFSFLHSVL